MTTLKAPSRASARIKKRRTRAAASNRPGLLGYTFLSIVILAALFLHEALTRRKLLGVALTISGVACMLLA